jgi:hypothetical protein
MKAHPIFSNQFKFWWLAMFLLSVLKFSLFGIPTSHPEDERLGIVGFTLSNILMGLILGSVIYLIYWLIYRKWNNKVFIYCIAVLWFILLIFVYR